MVDTFDNLSYQLDDLLSAGFSTCDQYETYQMLKVWGMRMEQETTAILYVN